MSDDIDIGQFSEALNDKADRDLNNTVVSSSFGTKLNSAGIRYVKESYRSGTSWYRLYSDGWVEQGGQFSNSSTNQNQTVNLLKTMGNNQYFISLQRIRNAYDASATYSVVRSVSTGSFTCYGLKDSTRWEVKGFGA